MNSFMEQIVTIIGLGATVAIVALLVSKKAQTPAVIQASGSAVNNMFAVAEAPVTGAVPNPVLDYPNTDLYHFGGFSPALLGGYS